MDCSPPSSSIHGIFQARVLEWIAISFSRGSSQPRDRICVSRIPGGFFTTVPPGSLRTIQLTYKSVILTTSFSDSIIGYNDSQNSGKHLHLWVYIKGYFKGYRRTARCKGTESDLVCPCSVSLQDPPWPWWVYNNPGGRVKHFSFLPWETDYKPKTNTCQPQWNLDPPSHYGQFSCFLSLASV